MSFDLHVFPEPGKTQDSSLDFNYTSNLLPAIRFATTRPEFWRNDGPMILARDLVIDLLRIRDVWRERADLYRSLDPDNGWGSLTDLAQQLQDYVWRLDRCWIESPEAEVGFYS